MSVNESCIPPKIRSSSNGLYVQFHSDDRMTAGGVRAVFVSAEGKYTVSSHFVYFPIRLLPFRLLPVRLLPFRLLMFSL